jgi:imidazolonepropionase
MIDLLVRNASEVVTCDGPLRASAEEALGIRPHTAIGVRDGRVAFIGSEDALPADAMGPTTTVVDAAKGFVGPGFVDCHTHVVFAGSRADEFEQRCQGKSYLEIAAAGGGISSTVRATREATSEALVAVAQQRLRQLLLQGVTTVEIKSGYGLTVESELRLLRIIRSLGAANEQTVVSTFLGLHAVPPEFRNDREAWARTCIDELLPLVKQEQLADFVDAFVEQSAFTHDEARRLGRKAHGLGLPLRLHVDQLTSNGGAQLAAELSATTADHLEQVSEAGIAALAHAGTVAVLAPTSTLFARARPYAPGRALIEAGVPVALCTNCNPGSSNSENVSLAMGLACLENGLTPAEAYLGFTRHGALALRRPDLGRLFEGGPADLVVFNCETYRDLPYHLAMNEVRAVIRAGRPVRHEVRIRP